MGLTRTRDKSYWESKNLILAAGEVGFEYDTGKSKLGNGHTRWKNLPYTSYPAFSVPEVVPTPAPTAAETVAESHDTDLEREAFVPARLSDATILASVQTAISSAHDTDAEREAFVPARISDSALRSAFGRRELFVSAYQSVPTDKATSAAVFTFRATHTLTQDVAGLRLALPIGFNVSNGQTACDVLWTGSTPVKVSVEIAGVIRPVTWQGTRVKTSDPGGVMISDLIAVDLPAGTKVPVRVMIPTTTLYPNTVGTAQGPGATATGDGYTNGSDTSDALTAVGVAITAGYFCHGLLAVPVSAIIKPSIAFIGDSITMGTGDGTNNGGWTAYTSNGSIPNLRLAVGGAAAQGWLAAHSYSWPWLQFCTHAVVLLGANDLNTSNGPRTLVQFQADLTAIYTALKNRGLKVYGCTILPRTNAANTAVASTAFNPGASSIRGQVNAWIRSGASGLLTGFFETADSVESARDSGFWALANLTSDGAHPTTAGHQRMAAVVNLASLIV